MHLKLSNLPMQGSAADLAKAAMIGIHTRLADRLAAIGYGGSIGGVPAARLVLQIHDEFLLEVAGGLAFDQCESTNVLQEDWQAQSACMRAEVPSNSVLIWPFKCL